MTSGVLQYRQKILTIEDLRFDPPQLPLDEVQQLALKQYGITGRFSKLAGERDQNFRIRCDDGRQFVLKISGSSEPAEVVEMQVQALCHIALQDKDLPVPRMIPGLDGRMITEVQSGDSHHAVRLLSWLPGLRYQDGPFPSAEGLQDLGAFIARLGLAMEGFDHPASRHFMPWNIANGLVLSDQLRQLLSAELAQELTHYFDKLEQHVFPRLLQQRAQLIHQDAHAANLLRESAEEEGITGVIDFGDMIHGPLVCDLAACASDFMEMGNNPLQVARDITLGFHRVRPLQESELELLLDMVLIRHIMVLQLFEFRRRNMDEPPDFVTDDQPAVIASLRQLMNLDHDIFVKNLKETVANA